MEIKNEKFNHLITLAINDWEKKQSIHDMLNIKKLKDDFVKDYGIKLDDFEFIIVDEKKFTVFLLKFS